MRLKDISKTATLAWSPRGVNDNQALLALGGYTGTEGSKNSDTLLELWNENPESQKPVGSIDVKTRFYDLAWEKSLDKPMGVIAGSLEDGGIGFWDPAAILKSDEASASIATYRSENGSILGPLDFNRLQPNLLASGDNKGDVWVWDIKHPQQPFALPKQNRSSEVHVVSWNNKVSHILASGNATEYTTVWDVKLKRQVLNLSYLGAAGVSAATGAVNSIAWHPNNATRLATAIDDNRNPIILTWDLRQPTVPQNILTGHQKAALSLSWCPEDPTFLLSSGKDGRAMVWNVETGESLGSFPRSGNWYTKSSWCPSNSNRVAVASLEGKVSIFSIQSTNTDKSQEASIKGATSIDDNEFFNNLPSIAGSQEPSFSLPLAPKWFKVPVGARFGFPNKIVSFSPNSKEVTITSAPDEVEQDEAKSFHSSAKFQTEKEITDFCQKGVEESASEEEAINWKLLMAVSERASRSKFAELLGYKTLKPKNDEDDSKVDESVAKDSTTPNELSKNANNENYDDDSSFYGKLAESVQEVSIADKKDAEIVKDSFKIFNPEDSDLEKNITKALLTGDVLSAVKACLEEKKISEALFLSTFGGKECRKCVRDAFYELQEHKPSYMRLSACIADNDLQNVVDNAEVSEWKDIFVFICTYATDDEFAPLCSTLGQRLEDLEDEKSIRSAEFCYIASKSLQSYANLWLKQLATSTKTSKAASAYGAYVEQLTKLMDKVSMFRSIVVYEDDELSATKDWKLAGLYEVYIAYAKILSASGKFDDAMSYLNLVPTEFPGAKEEIQRLTMLLEPHAVPPIHQIKQTGYAPVQPKTSQASSILPTVPRTTSYTSPYAATSSHITPADVHPLPPPSTSTTAGWNDAPMLGQLPMRRAAPSMAPVRSPFPGASSAQPAAMSRTSSVSTLPPPPPTASMTASAPAIASPPPPKVGETYHPPTASGTRVPPVQQPSHPNPYTPVAPQSPVAAASRISSSPNMPPSNPYTPIAVASSTVNPAHTYKPHGGSQIVPPPKQPANRVVPLPPTASQRASAYEPPTVSVPSPSALSPSVTPQLPPVSSRLPPVSATRPQIPQPPPVSTALPSSSAVSPPPIATSAGRSSTAASTSAPLTYPAGDRSHIPGNLRPIYEMLNAELQRVSQSLPPQMSRVVHDTEKRLNMLFDRLNSNVLSKPLTDELLALATSLNAHDYQTASNIQTNIVTTLGDQCEHWIVGVTRLITLSKSTT